MTTPEATKAAQDAIEQLVGPLLTPIGKEGLTQLLAKKFDEFAMFATSPQGWRVRQALDARRPAPER